jgi:integrase
MDSLSENVLEVMAQVGKLADKFVDEQAQARYQKKSTEETIRRQMADLEAFSQYLNAIGVSISGGQLYHDLASWKGVSYGLVEGFLCWQEQEGYAIGTINVRLSTVKAYARLANQAGAIPQEEMAKILMVQGYSDKQGRNVDEKRSLTRVGLKKAIPTLINSGHAIALKARPDTLEGRRDAVFLCLLLDHGLRCSEVVGLLREGVSVEEGTLTFYRRKVHLVQKHRLTPDTMLALMRYLPDIGESSYLFPGYKGGPLTTSMLNKRVGILGREVGIENLSPHDCRHYWVTLALRNKTDIKALQTAGGWKSPAMPLRYATATEIANEGVKLG